MIEINRRNIIIFSSVLILCFLAGIFFAKVYQPYGKTMKIYEKALHDYENGDLQNSYYLFSKIGYLSNLKPAAIYRQGLCAKEIGDSKTAVKQFQFLFKLYPKHKLSLRAKYLAAQLLVDSNPRLAQKYFDEIMTKFPNSDYAIASEYYSGLILLNSYRDAEIFPKSDKIKIENSFRHYLKKAPAGRLALQAVQNWLTLDNDISKDDYLLMAKTFYLFNDYEKAQQLLDKCGFSESWAVDVKNSYAMNNLPRAKFLTEYGVEKYSSYVDETDFEDAVNIYLQMSKSKYEASSKLLSLIGNKKGWDYIQNIKCQYSDPKDSASCYNSLYVKRMNGNFAPEALSQIFLSKIRENSIDDAKKIGEDFLGKFPSSNIAPMVMYWMGKLYQRTGDYVVYSKYFKSVISKYPDNYYAYRSYLKLNKYQTPLIGTQITPKPVEYPYKKLLKGDIIFELAELKDFEVLNELVEDNFVKSWVYYQKGDYSLSMLIARDAMDALTTKPDKYDLRWRLVYPVNFYDLIKKYADLTGNNIPLMTALIREESYFNSNAKSAAGASGLMQIMPVTAAEINSFFGLGLSSSSDLFNPNTNVELGNYYFAQLKSLLNGQDVSAVAAYNGGIGSVNNWKKSLYYNDTDDFIEQIPYPETKNYVKKVFRSYWNYLRIYTGNR